MSEHMANGVIALLVISVLVNIGLGFIVYSACRFFDKIDAQLGSLAGQLKSASADKEMWKERHAVLKREIGRFMQEKIDEWNAIEFK